MKLHSVRLKCFTGRKLKISFDAIKICMIYDAMHFVSMDIWYITELFQRNTNIQLYFSCNTVRRLISRNSFLAPTPFSHYFPRVKNYKSLRDSLQIFLLFPTYETVNK